jgi:hypothetical protein
VFFDGNPPAQDALNLTQHCVPLLARWGQAWLVELNALQQRDELRIELRNAVRAFRLWSLSNVTESEWTGST